MSLRRWKSPPNVGAELLEFKYGRLQSKNGIRLAQIQPGSGNKGIAINLVDSFVPYPGQQAHDAYDALSYTWGDGARTKNVVCNGRRLSITHTLWEALHHFRSPDGVVVLWIDQLCICQDRLAERGQQVELMGRIFKGADKVSVWLGAHENDSRAGAQLARQLLSIAKHHPVGRVDFSQLESYGLPKRGHRRWKALAAILQRPWFWRTWIVQEVVLNPNVELVLGDFILRWEDLEIIVGLLEDPDPLDWELDPTMSAWELPFSRINRIRLRHQRPRSSHTTKPSILEGVEVAFVDEPTSISEAVDEEEELDLLGLLLMSRDLGVTDPRDKVYALLGLSRHDMVPDYSSSPETIFGEFALHILGDVTKLQTSKLTSKLPEVRKFLILLACAGRQNQGLDLPSWVPDWTFNLTSRPLVFDNRFRAGGDVVDRLDWHFETGLQLCGRLIDTIITVGSNKLVLNDSMDARVQIEKWWRDAEQLASTRAVRSFGSTAKLDAFYALRRDLSICQHGYYRPNAFTKRRGSVLDESEMTEDNVHNPQLTMMLSPTRGRVFLVTTTGYIGLAPPSTKEGDLVYVMHGVNVPQILRPLPGTAFELIGETYVQGIMNGEALQMYQETGVEDIHIQ